MYPEDPVNPVRKRKKNLLYLVNPVNPVRKRKKNLLYPVNPVRKMEIPILLNYQGVEYEVF